MVTGSKGGGGKTPVAASIALALHKQGIPVLAADFNFNNHDLLTIFHGMNVLKRRKMGILKDYELNGDPYWQIADDFWLTQWHSVMDLGLPSTGQMWEKIQQICDLNFPSEKQPKVVIFDTNVTLPLICPPMAKIQDYAGLPQLEVWHLWSPSIVLQLNEQDRFVRSIEVLNRFSQGFEQRMTHIFTPRHFNTTSFFGTFSSIAKGEFNLTKNINYKQANPKPILFSEIKDVLFANFLPDILNYSPDDDIDVQEMLSDWLKLIMENLKKREYKTNNVIVVPTVVHNIALLVEKLTLKPRRTTETVIEDLGSLYDIVYEHFKNNRPELAKKYRLP